MAKDIKLTISEEHFNKFIKDLDDKIEGSPELKEDDIKIFGLTVKQYIKAIGEV